jgi:hypothetical protein
MPCHPENHPEKTTARPLAFRFSPGLFPPFPLPADRRMNQPEHPSIRHRPGCPGAVSPEQFRPSEKLPEQAAWQ